jgi:hypothetical protein
VYGGEVGHVHLGGREPAYRVGGARRNVRQRYVCGVAVLAG